MPVKNKVKERRTELGMTLEQLSKASGIPISTIGEIEHDGREPGVSAAISIAQALITTVEELWSK